MSAPAAAQAKSSEKLRLGVAASSPMPHFVFRALGRSVPYTELKIFGLIHGGSVTWRKGKWVCKWRSFSKEWLAQTAGVTIRSVESALARLQSEEMDWIESQPAKRGGREFRVKLIKNVGAAALYADSLEAECLTCGETAVIDPDRGYCPTPHSLFRNVARCVSYGVCKVVGMILDATKGWNLVWAELKLSEFELDTGLDRSVVQEALAWACEKGLIGIEHSPGRESSYRVFIERFSQIRPDPQSSARVEVGASNRGKQVTPENGEQKVETPAQKTAEKAHNSAKTRPVDFVRNLIARCRKCWVMGPVKPILSDVGGDSSLIPPPHDGKARVNARAGPPAEAKPAKKSKFDEAMERWEAKYGHQYVDP